MSGMTDRGRYIRPYCSVHGKGHKYIKQIVEIRRVENKTIKERFRICTCGHKRLVTREIIGDDKK